MTFGNWKVDEQGIIGLGGLSKYYIPSEQLNDIRNGNTYDLLIHLSEKTDVSAVQISELNEAYKYALRYFNVENIHNISFEDITEVQNKIISQKTK